VSSNSRLLGSFLQALGSPNALQLTVSPGGLLQAGLLQQNLRSLLQPVFAGLDPMVGTLLQALGVRLGYMDVTATGVRCGVAALVQ
jgi:uncharacterized membrane protein